MEENINEYNWQIFVYIYNNLFNFIDKLNWCNKICFFTSCFIFFWRHFYVLFWCFLSNWINELIRKLNRIITYWNDQFLYPYFPLGDYILSIILFWLDYHPKNEISKVFTREIDEDELVSDVGSQDHLPYCKCVLK